MGTWMVAVLVVGTVGERRQAATRNLQSIAVNQHGLGKSLRFHSQASQVEGLVNNLEDIAIGEHAESYVPWRDDLRDLNLSPGWQPILSPHVQYLHLGAGTGASIGGAASVQQPIVKRGPWKFDGFEWLRRFQYEQKGAAPWVRIFVQVCALNSACSRASSQTSLQGAPEESAATEHELLNTKSSAKLSGDANHACLFRKGKAAYQGVLNVVELPEVDALFDEMLRFEKSISLEWPKIDKVIKATKPGETNHTNYVDLDADGFLELVFKFARHTGSVETLAEEIGVPAGDLESTFLSGTAVSAHDVLSGTAVHAYTVAVPLLLHMMSKQVLGLVSQESWKWPAASAHTQASKLCVYASATLFRLMLKTPASQLVEASMPH